MPQPEKNKAKQDAAPEMSWEGRVEATEQKLSKALAEVETLKSQATALQATVEAYKVKEADRIKSEREAYTTSLQRKATEVHQSPIPAEDMQAIEAAFERNDEVSAKALGRAFLERSEAIGSAAKKAGNLQDFTPEDRFSPDAKKGRDQLLEAAGFELDDMPKRRARSRGPRWGKKAGR
jgi:hypothetical protein